MGADKMPADCLLVIREIGEEQNKTVYEGSGSGRTDNWKKYLGKKPTARGYIIQEIYFSEESVDRGVFHIRSENRSKREGYSATGEYVEMHVIPVFLTPKTISTLQQILDKVKQTQEGERK